MGRWLAYKKEMVQLGSIRKNPPPYDWELVMDCDLLREGIGLGRVGEREVERGLGRERFLSVFACWTDPRFYGLRSGTAAISPGMIGSRDFRETIVLKKKK